MTFLALDILKSGVTLSMVCAVLGLLFAFLLIKAVIRLSAGNDRMRQIAGAVEEGAKAYLKRQVVTISAIAAVIFVLLFIFRDKFTAIGFVIGAFCSLAAGYIGMRIAVLANTRTAQAASQSRSAAMRVAFNGGAVTGLLVVGLALLSVGIFYKLTNRWIGHDMAIKSLVSLALGASLISVFARLAGNSFDGCGRREWCGLGDFVLARDAHAFSESGNNRRDRAFGHRPLFRVACRLAHDVRCRRDHELLHLHALRAGAQDREGI